MLMGFGICFFDDENGGGSIVIFESDLRGEFLVWQPRGDGVKKNACRADPNGRILLFEFPEERRSRCCQPLIEIR